MAKLTTGGVIVGGNISGTVVPVPVRAPIGPIFHPPIKYVPWQRYGGQAVASKSNVIAAPGRNAHPPHVHHGGIHRDAVAATSHPVVTFGQTTSHNIGFAVKGRGVR